MYILTYHDSGGKLKDDIIRVTACIFPLFRAAHGPGQNFYSLFLTIARHLIGKGFDVIGDEINGKFVDIVNL